MYLKQFQYRNLEVILFWVVMILQGIMAILFFIQKNDWFVMSQSIWELERSVQTGITDEYLNTLYPFFVKLALFLQNHFYIPYFVFLYLGQGIFLGISLWNLLRWKQKRFSLGILLLCMSLPLTISSIFSTSGFAARAGLWCFFAKGILVLSENNKNKGAWAELVASFLLASVNCFSDWFVLGSVLLCWMLYDSFISLKKGSMRETVIKLILLITVFCVPVVIARMTQIPGSFGREPRTVLTFRAAFSWKTVFSYFFMDLGHQLWIAILGLACLGWQFLNKTRKQTAKPLVQRKPLFLFILWILFLFMHAVMVSFLEGEKHPEFGLPVLLLSIVFGFFVLEVPKKERKEDNNITGNWKRVCHFSLLVVLCVLVVSSGISIVKDVQHDKKLKKLTGTVICLGDSIWALDNGIDGIASIIEKKTELKMNNYAVSGTSTTQVGNSEIDKASLSNRIKQLDKEELCSADYVILAYGLNDYYSGISLEEYGEALGKAVDTILSLNREVGICIIGPTNCLYFQDGLAISTGADYRLAGGTLQEYSRMAIKIAAEKGVSFIDMQSKLPINRLTGNRYLTDATHLTLYGRNKYAMIVLNQILTDNCCSAKLIGN